MSNAVLIGVTILTVITSASASFSIDSHGVFYDSETSLHWYCSDDGNCNYSDIESWIRSINESRYPEGSERSMATLTELEDLFWNAGITWDNSDDHSISADSGQMIQTSHTLTPVCSVATVQGKDEGLVSGMEKFL